MRNLELQNFGVVEMDSKEMEETDGGLAPLIIWGLVAGGIALVGLGVGIYNGYKDAEAAAHK
jgi:lactobin A/cerein 7B family class IIb bacteriocin